VLRILCVCEGCVRVCLCVFVCVLFSYLYAARWFQRCLTTLSPPPTPLPRCLSFHRAHAIALPPFRPLAHPHALVFSTKVMEQLLQRGQSILYPPKTNEWITPLSSPCLCASTEIEAKPKLRPAGIKMLKCLWVSIPTSAFFLFVVCPKSLHTSCLCITTSFVHFACFFGGKWWSPPGNSHFLSTLYASSL